MRYYLSLFLFASSLAAQSDRPFSVSAGVKLGAPINDPSSRTSVYSTYNQSRWTGGPTVELHLPYGFAIEFDALYRSYRSAYSGAFQFGQNVNAYTFTNAQNTDVWDLPLMLKKRFQIGSFRPFVTAGYFWSRESSQNTYAYVCTGPQGSCLPPELLGPGPGYGRSSSSYVVQGPTAGTGIEFKTRYVWISPEVRFSRPTNGYPRDSRFTGMVGFTFGNHK